MPTSPLQIQEISIQRHEEFISRAKSVSFLQNPHWAKTKPEWEPLQLGWFRGNEIVAAALVLLRPIPVPGLRGRTLAYIADGPVFDPDAVELASLLDPLTTFLKQKKAFMIRMAPPFVTRRWGAEEVRKALKDGGHKVITDLEPLETDAQAQQMAQTLKSAGWEEPEFSEDFLAGQAQYQARIPLPVISDEARADRESEEFKAAVDTVLKRMDSMARANTRKSTRRDLDVEYGGVDDMHRWQALYEETAERDDFTGRPQSYFEEMFKALNASDNAECTLLFASYEDLLLASSIHVQQRDTAWYVYGASSNKERNRNAPRRLQLEEVMLAMESGARWLDLGGASPTLNKEHPLAGLSRFKTSQGADIMETLGEWDLPLNKPLAAAFKLYMARRG